MFIESDFELLFGNPSITKLERQIEKELTEKTNKTEIEKTNKTQIEKKVKTHIENTIGVFVDKNDNYNYSYMNPTVDPKIFMKKSFRVVCKKCKRTYSTKGNLQIHLKKNTC
jgi:hypothetical protein